MEPGHKAEITRRCSQMSGRTMLFDRWTGARGIADPCRLPEEFQRDTRNQIFAAAKAWADRLGKTAS